MRELMVDAKTRRPRWVLPEEVTRLTSLQIIRLLFPERTAERAQRATSSFRGRAPIAVAVPSDAELRCRLLLERLRWPHGVRCPRCDDGLRICRIEERAQFECGSCGYQFSVRAGTILHASHLPLWKWLLAVYLMTSADDITAYRLARTLGISYKTAAHLSHTIRAAIEERELPHVVGAEATRGPSGARVRGRNEHATASSTERADRTRGTGNRPLLVELLSRLIDADAGPDARLIASA
jgi:transposase-like protein